MAEYSKSWAVAKVESNNGLRIGMFNTCDVEGNIKILETNLTENEAELSCEKNSKIFNIPVFNETNGDVFFDYLYKGEN